LSPNSPEALAKSALMDYAKNDYRMAEKKLSFALQVEPEHKLSLQLLAQIQFNRGDLELAEKTAHDLLHIDPNDKFAKDVLSYLSNQR
jgi:Tfp pilus assembly protein PilF